MNRYGPDSIHSWIATVACFFISGIIYSVIRMSGVLFVASMQRFGVDRQSASTPYIITDFVQAISSPLTGYVTLRFGVRPVMASGCLLSAIGIGACFFAEDIGTVTIFWGVVFGVGFGLSVPLLAVVVTQHFVKKRAIAMGFIYFGGFVGFSTLPTLFQYLIDYYGLSGAFLYVSGAMLNCVPLAMFLRKPKISGCTSTSEDQKEPVSYEINHLSKETECDLYKTAIKSNACRSELQTYANDSMEKVNKGFESENGQDCGSINTTSVATERNNLREDSCQNVVKYRNEVLYQAPNKMKASEKSNGPSEKCESFSAASKVLTIDVNITDKDESISAPIKRKSNVNDDSVAPATESKNTASFLRAFKVFLEPIYIVILITEAVFEGSLIAFLTIIVDFSLDVGLPLTYAKYVILAFSIGSVIGLLSFGWVTDDGHLTLTNFAGLLFVLRCVTSVVLPFSNGLVFLLAVVAFQGMVESPLSNLFPLIIADYFAEEIHEVAISGRLFLCAPVYLVTPVLIGYFRDHLGSYLYLFYLISLCSLISGILLFLTPQLAKLRCGRERDERILRNKDL